MVGVRLESCELKPSGFSFLVRLGTNFFLYFGKLEGPAHNTHCDFHTTSTHSSKGSRD